MRTTEMALLSIFPKTLKLYCSLKNRADIQPTRASCTVHIQTKRDSTSNEPAPSLVSEQKQRK